MIDCIVCQYWSERLENMRIRSELVGLTQVDIRCVRAALRDHQVHGACALRYPSLLPDLIPNTEESLLAAGEFVLTV